MTMTPAEIKTIEAECLIFVQAVAEKEGLQVSPYWETTATIPEILKTIPVTYYNRKSLIGGTYAYNKTHHGRITINLFCCYDKTSLANTLIHEFAHALARFTGNDLYAGARHDLHWKSTMILLGQNPTAKVPMDANVSERYYTKAYCETGKVVRLTPGKAARLRKGTHAYLCRCCRKPLSLTPPSSGQASEQAA